MCASATFNLADLLPKAFEITRTEVRLIVVLLKIFLPKQCNNTYLATYVESKMISRENELINIDIYLYNLINYMPKLITWRVDFMVYFPILDCVRPHFITG